METLRGIIELNLKEEKPAQQYYMLEPAPILSSHSLRLQDKQKAPELNFLYPEVTVF